MIQEAFESKKELSILVVDDDKVDRLTVKDLLENNFEVHEASSGDEAKKRLGFEAPDCILLDYLIPGTDTLELLKELVQKGLPVIMLTGEGNEDVAVGAMKSGAQDYIVKRRLSTDLLTRTITSAVDTIGLKRQLATVNSSLEAKVEELQQLNSDLESFIHIVAHDLREPLRNLHVYCDLLQHTAGENLAPSSKEYLSAIQKSSQHLASLIDNLRELTRVVYGNVHEETIKLKDVVADILREYEDTIRKRKVKVEVEELPSVVGVRQLLRELYWNIIANTFKYVERDGFELRLTVEEDKESYVLGVWNSGSEVLPEEIERVFQPFYRIVASRTKEGSGMGLTLCKKIAERHGGTMWLESKQQNEVHVKFTLAKERYDQA